MGALEGLKILDFSTLLPGPYATLMLADMGAEVLKISSASRPDLVLDYPPFIGSAEKSADKSLEFHERRDGDDISAAGAWLNRNKKTMFLNLKTAEGVEIVKELVKDYDIVLEQFRPGVMNRLGLGYADLRAVNPRVIYCSLTGYGQTGPLAHAAGHDINYMSLSGIISQAGRKAEGPSLMNFQIADVAAGSLNAVIGILAAAIYRQRTGKGQFIDVSMLDGCVPFNGMDGAGFLVSGRQPKREGERLNGGSLYDYYETKDGEFLSVGALEPKFWRAFCTAIGREDLIDGGVFPDNADEVKAEIRSIMKTKTRDEWLAVFEDVDACVQPVLNLKEALLENEQIKARDMVVDVPMQNGGNVKQLATAIKLSETPCEYKHAGTPLGADTQAIVEKLGYDYDDLKAKGVFD